MIQGTDNGLALGLLALALATYAGLLVERADLHLLEDALGRETDTGSEATVSGAHRYVPHLQERVLERLNVGVDVELTDALVNEGRARQLQRAIQDARRQADLIVTDRIELVLAADDEVRGWLLPHIDDVASQVLATSTTWGDVASDGFSADLDGGTVQFSFAVAS